MIVADGFGYEIEVFLGLRQKRNPDGVLPVGAFFESATQARHAHRLVVRVRESYGQQIREGVSIHLYGQAALADIFQAPRVLVEGETIFVDRNAGT